MIQVFFWAVVVIVASFVLFMVLFGEDDHLP